MMELEYLDFSVPVKGVTAFSTTRGKVNGRNPYSGVNLCDYVGDDALRVLDADPAALDQQEQALEGVDALVTSMPGVVIGVNTADCVPIVLADEEAGVIAVAHAGWRGTVGRIARAVVEEMCRLGARAEHIVASMGPSICQDCFEVGDEVVEAFRKAHFDMDAIVTRDAATGKAHIDLRAANSAVLEATGVPVGNIVLSRHCSRCEHDHFFSARRLGIDSGRTFTGIYRK